MRSAAGRCSHSRRGKESRLTGRAAEPSTPTWRSASRRTGSPAFDFTDPAATARIAEEFDGWAPELIALITDGNTAPVLRPLHTLPVEHRWDRVPGVTLLGDAAHVMIPNGEGANLAMYDGAELGKALAAHPDDIEAALTAYERALLPRSAAEATEAVRLHEIMFGDNAPHSLISVFTGHE